MRVIEPQEYEPDQFTLINPVCKGGYGCVFKALTKDNKTIAIKTIPLRDKDGHDNKISIQTEASILAEVQTNCDDGILCFVDFMNDKDNFYIVTEYLESYKTLRDQSNMDDQNRLIISKNVAKALKMIHALKIAHRDIKPENIMYDPSTLKIKYIDFGLSCYDEQCNQWHSKGTLDYLAPELLNNTGKATFSDFIKADYWSLATVILEFICDHYLKSVYDLDVTFIDSLMQSRSGNVTIEIDPTLSEEDQALKQEQEKESRKPEFISSLEQDVTDEEINAYLKDGPQARPPTVHSFIMKYILPLLRIDPSRRRFLF